MECKEVLIRTDKYFENRLSDIEMHNIKKHLEKCGKCSRQYEDMSFVFNVLDNHCVKAPKDLASKIMMKINNLEDSKKWNAKVLRNLGASFVAAGIMITVLNGMDYNPNTFAKGLYKGAFEINQVVSNPITKISQGLRYVSDLYINDGSK
jgi:predicted anti-sigma-YlaC factor YlaD